MRDGGHGRGAAPVRLLQSRDTKADNAPYRGEVITNTTTTAKLLKRDAKIPRARATVGSGCPSPAIGAPAGLKATQTARETQRLDERASYTELGSRWIALLRSSPDLGGGEGHSFRPTPSLLSLVSLSHTFHLEGNTPLLTAPPSRVDVVHRADIQQLDPYREPGARAFLLQKIPQAVGSVLPPPYRGKKKRIVSSCDGIWLLAQPRSNQPFFVTKS